MFLRLRAGNSFVPGPWTLGRWSRPIGTIATIWVVFIAILFLLPQFVPVRSDTFNYAPVALGVVILFAGGWWVLSAKNWFKGPKVQGSADELAAIERDLELPGLTQVLPTYKGTPGHRPGVSIHAAEVSTATGGQ